MRGRVVLLDNWRIHWAKVCWLKSVKTLPLRQLVFQRFVVQTSKKVWYGTITWLKLHPDAVAGRGKVLLCAVRLKYCQHKEKNPLQSRSGCSSASVSAISQCFLGITQGSSVIQNISDTFYWFGSLRPFAGSLYLLDKSVGDSSEEACGCTRWHTTSLSKTTANKY